MTPMTDIATYRPKCLDPQSNCDDTVTENSSLVSAANGTTSIKLDPERQFYNSSEASLPSLISYGSSCNYSPAPSLSSLTPSSIGHQMGSTPTFQQKPQLQPAQTYQQYYPPPPPLDRYASSSSTLSDYSLDSRSYSSSVSSLPPIPIVPSPQVHANYSQSNHLPPYPQTVQPYAQPIQQIPQARQYPMVMATGMPSFAPIQGKTTPIPAQQQPPYFGLGYEYRSHFSQSIPHLNQITNSPLEKHIPGSPSTVLPPIDTSYYTNSSSAINRHNTLQSRLKSKISVKRKSKQLTTWTPSEDELLRGLKEVRKLGWREISTFFHERTPNACEFRWRRIIRSINESAGKPYPKSKKASTVKAQKDQMTPVTNIEYLLN